VKDGHLAAALQMKLSVMIAATGPRPGGARSNIAASVEAPAAGHTVKDGHLAAALQMKLSVMIAATRPRPGRARSNVEAMHH
jgi:hypothetical protein